MNIGNLGKLVNGKIQCQFVHCYFNCDSFKQRDIAKLNSFIGSTRLNNYLQFDGYANISFDEEDKAHRYPVISMLDDNGNKYDWSRKLTNCLVYNIARVDKNDRYDKIFLYQTCSHNGNGVWYGWLAWDSKNKKVSHRFFIDHDYQDLLQALNRMIYHIPVLKTNERLLHKKI